MFVYVVVEIDNDSGVDFDYGIRGIYLKESDAKFNCAKLKGPKYSAAKVDFQVWEFNKNKLDDTYRVVQ